MGDRSKIEWTEASWNPIRGCTRVSEGCRFCYAERTAIRFAKAGEPYEGLVRATKKGPQWTGKLRVVEEHMNDPIRWQRSRKIFVNSMSDLFHEKLDWSVIDRIFGVMHRAPRHVYQILTKRPQVLASYIRSRFPGSRFGALDFPVGTVVEPFVQLGTSIENQETADTRIPELLEAPAAMRWLSIEPLLGPVDISRAEGKYGALLSWIVVGGESGPGARPMEEEWVRSLIAQSRKIGIPCFVKQMGSVWASKYGGDRKGGDPGLWPKDLHVREYPLLETATR